MNRMDAIHQANQSSTDIRLTLCELWPSAVCYLEADIKVLLHVNFVWIQILHGFLKNSMAAVREYGFLKNSMAAMREYD